MPQTLKPPVPMYVLWERTFFLLHATFQKKRQIKREVVTSSQTQKMDLITSQLFIHVKKSQTATIPDYQSKDG
jgi:hypothetical protein